MNKPGGAFSNAAEKRVHIRKSEGVRGQTNDTNKSNNDNL